MGTNYYAYLTPSCPTCGHSEPPVHIGKSSAGWCFALHVIPEMDLNTWSDWEKILDSSKVTIRDEYNRAWSFDELKRIVTQRNWHKPVLWSEDVYMRNEAMEGPNNLVRSKIDGKRCVGHGEGTWDLFAGEFS